MLFNFALTPLDQITPWGAPEHPNLHWFGLTLAQYWIVVGEATLFEYSDYACREIIYRYSDYQLARLYEDLLEMLPQILEPVPSRLIACISGESGIVWQKQYHTTANELTDDEFEDIALPAAGWIGDRTLSSIHLDPSANIMIWSDGADVHFEWDNRAKFIEGQLAWTAIRGSYQLPQETFVEEVHSFHSRFMNEMEERVKEVSLGALRKEIAINIPQLQKEQEERRLSLVKAMAVSAHSDWGTIEAAVNKLDRYSL